MSRENELLFKIFRIEYNCEELLEHIKSVKKQIDEESEKTDENAHERVSSIIYNLYDVDYFNEFLELRNELNDYKLMCDLINDIQRLDSKTKELSFELKHGGECGGS